MNLPTIVARGPSRRHLLTGGLAGGFLLAFHLPVRAANEPVPMAYATEGPFAPNASFQCTAQLTGVEPGTTLHEDIGAVTGTGVTSKKVVTDSNPYYATTLYSLGDYVWYYTNHYGIQDATEAPAGVPPLAVTAFAAKAGCAQPAPPK